MVRKKTKGIKKTTGDYLHHGTRAALSVIPWIGGSAVELFSILIAPPLEKRLDEFLNDISDRLKRLEEQGKTNFKNLSENKEFISAVLQAMRTAISTHDEEKLNALRNAVINTALDDTLDDAKRQIFLRYIDELTPWHILILKGMADLRNAPPIPLKQFIDTYLPDFSAEEKEFFDVLQRELSDRGLLGPTVDGVRMSLDATIGGVKLTSRHGDEFLHFITEHTKEKRFLN